MNPCTVLRTQMRVSIDAHERYKPTNLSKKEMEAHASGYDDHRNDGYCVAVAFAPLIIPMTRVVLASTLAADLCRVTFLDLLDFRITDFESVGRW